MNNQDEGEISDNSVISDAPPPPPRRRREPTERRTIILRNKEIIRQLMLLGASTGKSVIVMSATGRISYAELVPRGAALEPLTVIRDSRQIDAIYGRIDPPFENAERDAAFLVTLSGIASACRGLRLVSHGDVELHIQLRRMGRAPVPQMPVQRTFRTITINTNRDICEVLALVSQRYGREIRLRSGSGKISDATLYSHARQLRLTNVGHADILQLYGVFRPNGTGKLLVTLSGVCGGTATAYRLISHGTVDVELFWLEPI